MLGFSLSKLVVLALIVAAVWYGFKLIGRSNKPVGRDESRENLRRAANDDVSRNTVHDMETCRVCGTFVPTGAAKACGRDGCPYPG